MTSAASGLPIFGIACLHYRLNFDFPFPCQPSKPWSPSSIYKVMKRDATVVFLSTSSRELGGLRVRVWSGIGMN
jgi:hypothetical protein